MEKPKHQITALTIIVSIILIVLIISLVNVGISIFLEPPEYNDFCIDKPMNIDKNNLPASCPEDAKQCEDGSTVSRQPYLNCEFANCPEDYMRCSEEYEDALKPYNQTRFYVLAVIGLALLLLGLFILHPMIQYTGLASGIILITEGVVTNYQNKTIVFISLVLIFIIFSVIAWRIVNKKH